MNQWPPTSPSPAERPSNAPSPDDDDVPPIDAEQAVAPDLPADLSEEEPESTDRPPEPPSVIGATYEAEDEQVEVDDEATEQSKEAGLPSMAELDALSAELDAIDSVLARMDAPQEDQAPA